MIPINNSDTAWLIVTDYNQENNLPYEELREDILNPETNHWIWELNVHMIIASCTVGSDDFGEVGGDYFSTEEAVGDSEEHVGGENNCSNYVGGNKTDQFALY